MSYLFIILFQLVNFSNSFNSSVCIDNDRSVSFSLNVHPSEIYDTLNCKELSYSVFELAYKGYSILNRQKQLNNNRFLTIVDFSKSITDKRFFVIDFKLKRVAYIELVAHAKETDYANAKSFSNEINSEKNSLGFYLTGRACLTKTGYALRLFGLENDFNDNAFARGIMLHGSDTVITRKSKGCIVISNQVCFQIIEIIKNESCLFVYYPEEAYLKGSSYLNLATN